MRLAASEILVPTGAGETVEALDGGGENRRVEIDQAGELGDAAGLAEPVGIAPPEAEFDLKSYTAQVLDLYGINENRRKLAPSC